MQSAFVSSTRACYMCLEYSSKHIKQLTQCYKRDSVAWSWLFSKEFFFIQLNKSDFWRSTRTFWKAVRARCFDKCFLKLSKHWPWVCTLMNCCVRRIIFISAFLRLNFFFINVRPCLRLTMVWFVTVWFELSSYRWTT